MQEVRNCFLNVDRVSAEILENDKTECVDGCLKLYSSDKMSVKTLEGDIDVQVKGTTSKRKSDPPKRRVKVGDLRYYLDHGGVLYFVVYEKDSYNEVYFAELLPFDIRKLLRDCGNQKTAGVRLRPFPSDPNEVLRILIQVLRDKKNQRASAGFAHCSLEEYEENGFNFKSQRFTVDVGRGESLASLAPYKNGVYNYAVDEHGQLFAIDKLENLYSVAVGQELTISSGTESFTTTFFDGENEDDGDFYKFDGFTLILKTNSLKLDEEGSLAVRLRDLRLMRELKRTGVLVVSGKVTVSGFSSDDEAIDAHLSRRIETLERIDSVLKKLRVKVDLDPGDLSEQNLSDLDALAHVLLDGEVLHRPGKSRGFCLVKLPGFWVKLLMADKGDDNFEAMDILDVDTTQVTPFLIDEAGNPLAPVPSLLIQSEEELCHLGNIDADVFAAACDRIPITEESAPSVTLRLLNMIAAYDVGAVCGDELLKCCEILCERLQQFDNEGEISEVNRLQIKKRMSRLDDDDDQALARLVAGSKNIAVKCCASILREDFVQARVCLEQMSEREQEELCSWPIWHLMPDEEG